MGNATEERAAAARELIKAVKSTLGTSFAVSVDPEAECVPLISPLAWVALWLTLYGSLIAAVLGFTGPSPRGHGQIVSLLIWFALYFAAALYVTQSTIPKILKTITNDIIPHAPAAYLKAVASDLNDHFTRWQRIGVPLLVATVSIVAAIWVFGRDIKAAFHVPGLFYSWEMALWGASYFLCFYTAAKAVVAGQFHLFFARNVWKASSLFYVLGAAETPIVKGLARLGTQVLIFWVLIFLAIASCMFVAVLPEPYYLPATSLLLSTMIPISLFFSLGFGTLVYLGSEASIRAALQRFTALQTAGLQHRMNELLFPAEGTLPSDTKELDRLIGWHDRITGGGRYGSRIGAAVSITLPLLLPVVSLILSQL
jgi:hypothetical protein